MFVKAWQTFGSPPGLPPDSRVEQDISASCVCPEMSNMNRPTLSHMTSSVQEIRSIAWTFFLLLILYGGMLVIIATAFQYHWLLGLAATFFYAFGLVAGLRDLISREASRFAVRKGLAIFVLLVLTGAAVFGALSLLLEVVKWAVYTSEEPLTFVSFHLYYLWLFLEMLPVLKITETLNLTAPIQPKGFVAGLPVIAFRGFVVYGLLRALKIWWNAREPKNVAPDNQTDSKLER